MAGEEQIVAGKIPDDAAEAVVHDRCKVLADVGHIIKEKHDPRADDEVQNADQQIKRQRFIDHLFQLQAFPSRAA